MARAMTAIDVGDSVDLRRLVQEIRAGGEPIVLREGGEEVAVVLPADGVGGVPPYRERSEAERQAFLATAGRWEGLIDVDEFLEDVHESRRLPPRPPVDFG
jgi:GGDEF domain-containing protein